MRTLLAWSRLSLNLSLLDLSVQATAPDAARSDQNSDQGRLARSRIGSCDSSVWRETCVRVSVAYSTESGTAQISELTACSLPTAYCLLPPPSA